MKKLLLEAKIHWEEVQQMISGANAQAGASEAGATAGADAGEQR